MLYWAVHAASNLIMAHCQFNSQQVEYDEVLIQNTE
jgi:hypothetical protein